MNVTHKYVKQTSYKFDYIFVIKGNHIYPSTIKQLRRHQPQAFLINWSLDDMQAKHNRSIFYTINLKHYDLVVSTKSYNCLPNELPKLGAKKVLFQNNSFYNYPFLRDIERPKQFKYDVCFIGTAEIERFNSMNFLAKNGVRIKIFGSNWDEKAFSNYSKNISIDCNNLDQESYYKTIADSKISLCFLRKINRDLQTLRSVEIPAVGGFMIAERTSEHLQMFKENSEAVFFSNDNELLEQVKRFLSNDTAREEIALNGKKRCHSDYRLMDRMIEILNMSDIDINSN